MHTLPPPRRLLRLIAFALALIAAPALAQDNPAAAKATNIRAVLAAESVAPAPGRTVTLAIEMTPDKGWHGYWANPGDAGVPTRAQWTLPPGVSAGALSFPVPHRLVIAGLMNYVYEGPYALLVGMTLPPDITPGAKLPIRLKLDWLACTDEICVPESGALSLDLIVGDGTALGATQARFDRYRAALPRPLGSRARFASAAGRFRIAIPLPAATVVTDPYFYPLTDGAIDYAAPQAISRAGDLLIMETKTGLGNPDRVEGVLRIGEGLGLTIAADPGTVPAAGTPVAATDQKATGGLGGAATILLALSGAVLGGLLLNVMPCVFPILSLKALSLARAGGSEAGGSEAAARSEAIAYTAGAVLVCLGLGALLLALRAGGSVAGWAFQLQDPRVILVLLLLVTAIAFNLAGLFELRPVAAGQKLCERPGRAGSFWTGALAAFVATPCTGPFMGAALGAALVLPVPAALAVFGGLGFGLALPFLLLGFVPALRRRLPRPGPWMARLRRILSLPMFATALGLAWVLGRQAGVDAMTLGLAAAIVLALALWWFGARAARGTRAAWAPLLPAAAIALGAVAILPHRPVVAVPSASLVDAQPFDEARLAALRSEGRPVFVYFTADWCITCKVNEKAAIERAEVIDAFAARGVRVLVGDWTGGDPAIGRFLARHGRSGVPLYLFYRPDGGIEVLPQILTPARLVALARDPGRAS